MTRLRWTPWDLSAFDHATGLDLRVRHEGDPSRPKYEDGTPWRWVVCRRDVDNPTPAFSHLGTGRSASRRGAMAAAHRFLRKLGPVANDTQMPTGPR